MAERTWIITDEEYQQQHRMPVEATRAVFTVLFGPGWKKAALSMYRRYGITEADISQWERFGCPPNHMDEMLGLLRAHIASAEGARLEELEAALKTVPFRPTILGVSQH
ncbi:MAG TPA: hypothetical protein VN428_22925 [Bryobacteraceae bacterium]|nr:hypothetical protein [Bryobacteraceae bacterium]